MNSLKNHQKTVHNCSLYISLLKENLWGSYPKEEKISSHSVLSFLDFFMEGKFVRKLSDRGITHLVVLNLFLEGKSCEIFVIVIKSFRDSWLNNAVWKETDVTVCVIIFRYVTVCVGKHIWRKDCVKFWWSFSDRGTYFVAWTPLIIYCIPFLKANPVWFMEDLWQYCLLLLKGISV